MGFQGWLAEVFGATLKRRHGAEKCLFDCLENMDYERKFKRVF